MDALNLEYVMIIDKKSSLNIYTKEFGRKGIDGTLVSGFLEAIRSFGIELTESEDKYQTIKLEYKKSKILMSEYKSFRLILIMKKNPSEGFFKSLKNLSKVIEKEYGKRIKNFQGELDQFNGLGDLIDDHLQTNLAYPLQINEDSISSLNASELSLLNRGKKIMKRKRKNSFRVVELLEENGGFQVNDAQNILNLLEKQVFLPINN